MKGRKMASVSSLAASCKGNVHCATKSSINSSLEFQTFRLFVAVLVVNFLELSSPQILLKKCRKIQNARGREETGFEYWKTESTVFENHRKSRAKRATFTFWVDKSLLKLPKIVNFWRAFESLKLEMVKQCYQTGDRSYLVKNAKIEQSKCDKFDLFTSWCRGRPNPRYISKRC